MNTDIFNTLAEKLYPNKQDREDVKLATRMIVTTVRFMDAKKACITKEFINAEDNYNDAKKEIRSYLDEYNACIPGSFLIPIDKIKLDKLRELINFTFDETKRTIYTDKEKEMLLTLLTDENGNVIRP